MFVSSGLSVEYWEGYSEDDDDELERESDVCWERAGGSEGSVPKKLFDFWPVLVGVSACICS